MSANEAIRQVRGRGVHVPGDDIDTDRIIPARFMKCVTFDGLGEYAFYDARFDDDGRPGKNHPFDDPRFEGASVLISGQNFGCGSSREHAPQALYRHGIRAVVAESFAEIFFGNSVTLGMPCVTVSRADRLRLAAAVEADPAVEITVDVDAGEVRAGDSSVPASVPAGARDALLNGRWDPLAELLEARDAARDRAADLGYALGAPR